MQTREQLERRKQMTPPQNTNGWSEYQKLVLYRLDTIEDRLKDNDDTLEKMNKRISILGTHVNKLRWRAKTIASVFGLFAGMVPLLVSWVLKK